MVLNIYFKASFSELSTSLINTEGEVWGIADWQTSRHTVADNKAGFYDFIILCPQHLPLSRLFAYPTNISWLITLVYSHVQTVHHLNHLSPLSVNEREGKLFIIIGTETKIF